MQMGALTLKITENINKINDLLEVDKSIKKDIVDNSNLNNSNKNIVDNKVSKLDQNLILFNTNLTNFIDSTKNTIDNINLSIDKIPNIENNITINLSKISQNFAISSINFKKIKNNNKFIINWVDNIENNILGNYVIDNIFLYNNIYNDDFYYILAGESFCNIWNITIDKPFKKESILEINEMIKYSFIDHKNTFYLVKERYILFWSRW